MLSIDCEKLKAGIWMCDVSAELSGEKQDNTQVGPACLFPSMHGLRMHARVTSHRTCQHFPLENNYTLMQGTITTSSTIQVPYACEQSVAKVVTVLGECWWQQIQGEVEGEKIQFPTLRLGSDT